LLARTRNPQRKRQRGVGGCNGAILRGVFAYRRIGRLSLTDFYENANASGLLARALALAAIRRANMKREKRDVPQEYWRIVNYWLHCLRIFSKQLSSLFSFSLTKTDLKNEISR